MYCILLGENGGTIASTKTLVQFSRIRPDPSGEILSGYEDVVSSGQDCYTTWVKTDPDVKLERYMVDVQKAVAEYREAALRRQESTTQEYLFL